MHHLHQPRGQMKLRRAWYAAHPPRRSGRPARRRAALLLALSLTILPAGAGAQQGEAVRAAFVLNFLKFAEWPATVLPGASSPLVVATIGDDAQAAALQAGLDGKEIQGRRVQVKVYRDAAHWRGEGAGSHALFITSTAAAAWAELRAEVEGRPVLTICESPGFCEQGGMLNLYEEDHRIRFEANPAAADKAGLKLRSTLLTLATIVKTKGGK